MFTMCCQPPKFRMLNPSLVRVSTCFCYRMRNSLLRGLLATPKPTIHRQCNLETSAADFRVLTAAAGCTTAEDKSIFLIDLLIRRSGFVDFLPAEHNNMLFLGGGDGCHMVLAARSSVAPVKPPVGQASGTLARGTVTISRSIRVRLLG